MVNQLYKWDDSQSPIRNGRCLGRHTETALNLINLKNEDSVVAQRAH